MTYPEVRDLRRRVGNVIGEIQMSVYEYGVEFWKQRLDEGIERLAQVLNYLEIQVRKEEE